MVVRENKNSFFCLRLDTSLIKNSPYQLDKLDNSVDLIFSTMKVRSVWYKFVNKNKLEYIYLFKTEDRKRKGQLAKACEKIFDKDQEYQIDALNKFSFEKDLCRFEQNENFELSRKPVPFSDYTADDIKIFYNPKNWYPWQKDLYKMIFDEDGSFKEPHPRHIISIVDKPGCSRQEYLV